MKSFSVNPKIVYHIEPNLMYGWNFKYADSRYIIKFGQDRNIVLNYAESYCRSRNCELVVFDHAGNVEEIISFTGVN
jgi:hypothetical protein